MITRFIRQFTDENIEYEKIDRAYYYIPEQLKEIVEKHKPFAAGLFLGEDKGKQFMPSIALLDWIAKRSRRKIVLNKKTAWLFTCGRDIFIEGIVSGSGRKNDLVLIQNEDDENLGYGRVEFDLSGKSKGMVAITNILDKGHFLRKEKKGDAKA